MVKTKEIIWFMDGVEISKSTTYLCKICEKEYGTEKEAFDCEMYRVNNVSLRYGSENTTSWSVGDLMMAIIAGTWYPCFITGLKKEGHMISPILRMAHNGDVVNLNSVSVRAANSAGLLYVGGNWVGWDGTAGEDYITSFDGTTWTQLGTSPFSATVFPTSSYAFAIDQNDDLISGSGGGGTPILTRWDGSTWTTLGSASAAGAVYCVLVLAN